MELTSRALFAKELYPLRNYFEERLDRICRWAAKPAETMARSPRPVDDRHGASPPVERNADAAVPRSSGSRHDVVIDTARRSTTATGQITVVVLALDTYNARVYHDMLEMRGYYPITASAVESWLDVLNETAPDLILIDLCASDHPSIDIACAIMADRRYKAVPIVMVTDAYQSGDLNDPATIIVDCDGRISKPISIDGFYRPIEAILKRATVRRQNPR